jgi:hypothetical protein
MNHVNHVLDYMKANNVPLTREKYLEYAYFGNPPEKLSAEEEADLPEELKGKSQDGNPAK